MSRARASSLSLPMSVSKITRSGTSADEHPMAQRQNDKTANKFFMQFRSRKIFPESIAKQKGPQLLPRSLCFANLLFVDYGDFYSGHSYVGFKRFGNFF